MDEPIAGRGRVSMADVAALAGVSGQTVSRVANQHPRVDAATRARVEAAMAELGYRPHRAARALRTGRSQSIGVVVATLATVGNTRMLEAVSAAASAQGYALVVVSPADRSGLDGAFTTLRDQGVDGAIVLNEATALARGAETPRGARPRRGRLARRTSGSRSSSPTTPAAPTPPRCTCCRSATPTVWHLGGPGDVVRRGRARGRLARGARRGGDRRTAGRARRLERGIRPRRAGSSSPRGPTCRRSSPRTTRWPSACCAPLHARGARRARRGQRGRLRRRGGCRGLHAAADDRAAGLRHPRAARRRGARGAHRAGGADSRTTWPRAAGAAGAPALLRDVVPTRLVVRESSGPAASVAP